MDKLEVRVRIENLTHQIEGQDLTKVIYSWVEKYKERYGEDAWIKNFIEDYERSV